MMEFETRSICKGVNFNNINDNRFKTGRISATFFMPLCKDTVSSNGILPSILTRSCKEYPNFVEINKKLEELYGAYVYAEVRKFGEVQGLTISAVGLDDKYSLYGESISGELAGLLCSIIFNPDIQNGKFKAENIEQEKRQLIELIDSEYNNKRSYAKMRCEELMCAEEKFGINKYGTRKQVEALTSDDIYDAWQRIIKTARVEIMMVGASNPDSAFNMFKNAFEKVDREYVDQCSTHVIKSAEKVKEYTDVQDVKQCKLVMGFRTGVASPEDVMATRVMIALLGGTPHSKFFLNIREKMSLCYYCSARFDRYKGLMIVESGVQKSNLDKTKQEVLNQIKSIQDGDFDDSQIEATKLSLSNTFRTVSDSIGSLEDWYIGQTFEDKTTPEQLTKELIKVTRQEIINAAKKLSLDTIYELVGNGEVD